MRLYLLFFIPVIGLLYYSCGERRSGNILLASASAYTPHPEKTKKVNVDTVVHSAPVPVLYDSAQLEEIKKIDEYFSRLHKLTGFNGAVLLARDGKVLYKNGFGYANYKTKDTVTTSTPFQLASVSKQFTAVAIMMLKEKGVLEYSDEVQKHIPEFPYKKVTIRDLLSHRSGLANYMYFTGPLWDQRQDSAMSNEEMLDLMCRYKPVSYRKPNRRYQYSNTGYSLLASIVERISGLSFSAFMESHVFRRLGMNNTYVYSKADEKDIPGKAIGYERIRWRPREAGTDYLDGVTGDKGVYSTVEDLYIWDQALYTEKLLCQNTLEEAFKPACRDLRGNNYGFGWRISKNRDGDKIVYHKGWWHGFNTSFSRNIDDKSTVIILSNVLNKVYASVNELEDIPVFHSSRAKRKKAPAARPLPVLASK